MNTYKFFTLFILIVNTINLVGQYLSHYKIDDFNIEEIFSVERNFEKSSLKNKVFFSTLVENLTSEQIKRMGTILYPSSRKEMLKGSENAAPSIHLFYEFNSNDFILKMNKIKITESAPASYFEVNAFTLGYTGLQQTTIDYSGQKNINLFSVWDPDTKQNIFSKVEYMATNTISDRFGGEGNGWKTINPMKWEKNVWYNIVTRAWKSKGKLFIANFIQNSTSGEWTHTATLSIPDPGSYLNWYNNAFLENWDGFNPLHDGRFKRSAYFKDAWNLNLNGKWEKNTFTRFSANGAVDEVRNGIYHNSFNAFYDSEEDAYFLQHGGDTKRSDEFGGKRELNLPNQKYQGDIPILPPPNIANIDFKYSNDSVKVQWTIDSNANPQLSYELDLLTTSGEVIFKSKDTIPNKRAFEIQYALKPGMYKARVLITDIFGQQSQAIESNPIFVENSILSIIIDDLNCGTVNEIVKVPIRVKNFNNIRSFQFTVFIPDTTVGKIMSISKGDLNGDMLFSYHNASTSGIIWDNINSISLNDNHTIAIISIKLQNSNRASPLLINNSLVDIYVENEEGMSIQPDLDAGSICTMGILTDSDVCDQIKLIYCNDSIVDYIGRRNNLSYEYYSIHANKKSYLGNENLYKLKITRSGWYDIKLSSLTTDFDLFLLSNICPKSQLETGELLSFSAKNELLEDKIGPIFLSEGENYFLSIEDAMSLGTGSFSLQIICLNSNSLNLCEPSSNTRPYTRYENFEQYESPWLANQSEFWNKEATVVSTGKAEGKKALVISKGLLVPFNLYNLKEGIYRISNQLYVYQSFAAQIDVVNSINPVTFAYSILFETNGNGKIISSADTFNFQYEQNKWLNITQIIDFDANLVEVFIENTFIGKLKYSDSDLQINSLRFSGINDSTAFFIDDVCIRRAGCRDTIDTDEKVCLYPGKELNIGIARCKGYTFTEWKVCSGREELTFDLDDSICGNVGEVIKIPIRVRNFRQIRSFQFTISIDGNNVGQVVSIEKGNIIGDMFSSVSNINDAGLIWDNLEAVSLNDETIIAYVHVKILSLFTRTKMSITSNLSDIYVENSSGLSVNPVLISGSFCSKQSFNGSFSKMNSYINRLPKKDDDSNIKFTLYPNPTSGQIKIKGNANFEIIEVYSSTGAALGIKTPLSLEADINLSNFPPGIYQAKINEKNSKLNVFKYLTISKL